MPINFYNGDSISATTVSATTFYGNGANLTGISGGFTGGTVTGGTNFTDGLSANTISATTYYGLPTGSNLIFMFNNVSSDIPTYSAATPISSYSAGTLATKTTAITTTPTLIGTFSTPSVGLGITYLPPIIITSHFETQKDFNGQGYYSYFELYKRNTGGTETLIGISDNSTVNTVNLSIQNTLTCTIVTGTTFNITDRVIIKIYSKMISSSANINLYYADNTNARLEIPLVVGGGTWNGGTVANASTFQSDVTFNGNINDGNNTIDAGMMIQASLIFLAQNT